MRGEMDVVVQAELWPSLEDASPGQECLWLEPETSRVNWRAVGAVRTPVRSASGQTLAGPVDAELLAGLTVKPVPPIAASVEPEPLAEPDTWSSLDLHCHTSHSFDGYDSPADVVAAAVRRGLTHLAVTDHDTISGALAARAAAPEGLRVIVGQEVRTRAGDLIALFIQQSIPTGLELDEAIAAIREQGGVVGVAHPFDTWRPSVAIRMTAVALERLAEVIDYVEAYNARVRDPQHDARAGDFARLHRLPVVATSDAHSAAAVGSAHTNLSGPVDDAASFLRALRRQPRRHFIRPLDEPAPVPSPGPTIPARVRATISAVAIEMPGRR